MFEHDKVLPNAVAQRALTDPDAIAVQEADGDGVLTWREYDSGNRRYAAALRTLGIAPGDRVATIIPLGVAGLQVWNGLALIQAIEVPLNPMLRGRMLARLVEPSDARIIVVAAQYLDTFSVDIAALPHIDTVVVLGRSGALPAIGDKRVVAGDDLLAAAPDATDLYRPRYWDIASVTFTSGTTGGSKGVILPWGHLYASAQAQDFGFEAGEGFYLPSALFHYGARYVVQLCAMTGVRLVTRQVFSTREYWHDIRRFDISWTYFLGPWANFLMNEPARPDDRDNPVRKAHIVPLIERHEMFAERFGIQLFSGYGSTEVGSLTNTFCCPDRPQSAGSVRATDAGREVRLVDENDQPVACGEVGELVVRSSESGTTMMGYLGNAEAMVRTWRNGWLHSGDSFFQDEDGHYHFVDRAQDVIRRRGENISSLELEAAVLHHPAVAEVAAIGVPSPFGEQDVLIAVVLHPGQALDASTLAAALDGELPKFMRPRYIDFHNALPKTQTQRVRKGELRDRGLHPSTWDREIHQRTRSATDRTADRRRPEYVKGTKST